jgi:hypothetical protein
MRPRKMSLGGRGMPGGQAGVKKIGDVVADTAADITVVPDTAHKEGEVDIEERVTDPRFYIFFPTIYIRLFQQLLEPRKPITVT